MPNKDGVNMRSIAPRKEKTSQRGIAVHVQKLLYNKCGPCFSYLGLTLAMLNRCLELAIRRCAVPKLQKLIRNHILRVQPLLARRIITGNDLRLWLANINLCVANDRLRLANCCLLMADGRPWLASGLLWLADGRMWLVNGWGLDDAHM